jgi:hypothetical protein
MSKVEQELQLMQEIVADLEAVCKKHNIVLAGTCMSMAMLGEITILKKGQDLSAYQGWDKSHYGDKCEDVQSSMVDYLNDVNIGVADGDDVEYPFPFVYGIGAK